jgi:HEAT repeat protein
MQHRQYAAAALALLAGRYQRALVNVEKLLSSDREATVRSFTAAALGQERCRAAIPALRKALDDDAGIVALSAAKALWDMGDHSGVTIFEQVLTGERKDSNSLISGYLTDAKHTLHDPKSLALMGVKEATGAFFGPAGMAIGFAQESFKDKGATGRALAAGELAKQNSKQVREVLRSALQDSNGVVRAAVCRSLAISGGRDSLPFIEPLLSDKNEAAQAMAAAAYIMLSSPHQKSKTGQPGAVPKASERKK